MPKSDRTFEEVSKIWIDYYHEITGNEGAPHCDDRGSLFGWIAEYDHKFQTRILDLCYAAGLAAGGAK